MGQSWDYACNELMRRSSPSVSAGRTAMARKAGGKELLPQYSRTQVGDLLARPGGQKLRRSQSPLLHFTGLESMVERFDSDV